MNLGRADDNHIVLKADSVSRRHARFLVDANRVVVEDLGSGNGTFFRGEKLFRRTELADGDEVSITPFTLRLLAPHLPSTSPEFGVNPGADARTVMMSPVEERPTAPAGTPQAAYAPGQQTGAQLFVVRGQAARASYDLVAGPFTMGRADDRDMVLSDPASSRRHATIHFEGDHYRVVDDGSANGLIINGAPSRDARLRTGDKIVIGETEMEFMWPGGPPTSQPGAFTAEDPYSETNFIPAYDPWEPTDQVGGATSAQGGFDQGYGVEMAPIAQKKSSPLRLVAIALFALVVIGGIVVAGSRKGSQSQGPQVAAISMDPCDAYDLNQGCADAVDEVCRRCLIKKTRMENGKELFRQKEFSRALQEFQQILQTIDANHTEARRMAYLTYEFWVIQNIDETLQDKAQTFAQKMDKLSAALNSAKEIYEKWGKQRYTRETPESTLRAARASLNTGVTAVNDALQVKVDDADGKKLLAEAEELKPKLLYKLSEIRRVLEAGTVEALENEMDALFNEAMSLKQAGKSSAAIKKLNELISKDTNGESDLSRKAKAEIVAINASIRAQAAPYYNKGVANLSSGLLLEARANLDKALSIDPTYSEAKAKQREVEQECLNRGKALYNEAKIQYNVAQYSQAEKLLRQVLEFIPNPKEQYHERAEELLGKIQKNR